MQKSKTAPSSRAPINKKRILIIFISVFVGAAVLFGATLGTISAIKNANAVYCFEGITMDEEVASFFVGRFKTKYIHDLRTAGYSAENTEAFWNSRYDDERTHGEVMQSLAERQLKQILVGNYFFDRYSSLSDRDEELIEKAVRETVEYQTGGSEEEFLSISEGYGFDLDSYREAVEMLYKSDHAFTAIYGQDGSAISNDKSKCAEYLSRYSHVSLIFIRTEDKLVTFEDGRNSVVSLDEDEKALRNEGIEKIRAAIKAFNDGSDGMMTSAAYANYLDKYGEGDGDYDELGYYFHEDSEFTAEYSYQFPEVTKKALSMDVGTYAEVEVDFRDVNDTSGKSSPGYCFIYKYAPTSDAYLETRLERCFSDFYYNAATTMFIESSDTMCNTIERGNKFSAVNFYAIATNSLLYPRYDAE